MSRAAGAVALLVAVMALPAAAAPARVGTYYYPGWSPPSPWLRHQGWAPIKRFPDRKPLLGWYRDDDPAVMAQQLRWMGSYGLSWVAFDWYHSQGDVRLDHAVEAYRRVPQSDVAFSLLWANHDDPTTPAIWAAIVDTWIARYFADPRYLRIDGKPVVFVFNTDKLARDAQSSRSTLAAYLRTAQARARAAGHPGLYLVAGSEDLSTPLMQREVPAAGFAAVSAYNFQRKPASSAGTDEQWARPYTGYAALDAAARLHWAQGRKLPVPLIVPMSAGWNAAPWNDPFYPRHAPSIATPSQFAAHLTAGRTVMTQPGGSGLGMICCWNEFGEGSFIEPTAAKRFAMLEAVRKVFGE